MMKRSLALGVLVLTLTVVPGCAFTGSEPGLVTHPVDGDYGDCGSCHAEGTNGAPKTDHIRKDDCLSCHAAVKGG